MATKTITAKESTVNYAAMSEKELHDQLSAKRTELLEKQRSLKAGELPNPRTIGALRKDVARILTVLQTASATSTDSDEKSGEEE